MENQNFGQSTGKIYTLPQYKDLALPTHVFNKIAAGKKLHAEFDPFGTTP